MKKNIDRRLSMINQLNKFNLEYEFIDAVNGRELSEDDLESVCDYTSFLRHPFWETRGKGMIGCSLSHRNVYKKIVDNKLSGAIVLEDDAILSSNFSNILKKFEEQKAKVDSKELVLFYTESMGEKVQLSTTHSRDVDGNYKLYYPINYKNIWMAAAYYISYDSAKSFLQKYPKVSIVADRWHEFHDKGILSTYSCMYPYLIKHGDFESVIGKDVSSSHNSKIKQVIKNISPTLLSLLLKIKRKVYATFNQGVVFSRKISPIDNHESIKN